MHLLRGILLCSSLAVIAGQGSPADGVADLTIANVQIVPIGGVEPGRAHIAITGGRIVAVTAAREAPPAARRTVDVDGAFALPGLWDMHVHALDEPWREWQFALLTANGVTGIRDMNGATPLAEALALRARIEAGEVLAPWFVYPGPIVDGPGRREPQPNVREVATAEEARQAVRDLAEAGADFIKPYNRLTPDLYFPLVSEAERLGMPVYGHVPHAISLADALTAGHDSVEHLGNILESSSPDWPELRRLTIEGLGLAVKGQRPPPSDIERFMALRASIADIDPEALRTVVRISRDAGVAHTPTLVSNRAVLLSTFDAGYRDDARLAYLQKESREAWLTADFRRSFGTEEEDFFRRRFASLERIVLALHEGGVRLLAGSDAPSPFVLPGFGLHDELRLLVAAGLSPLAALEAATIEPARFLGLAADRGSLAAGRIADIVLLERDPLRDITATRDIVAVVRGGRLLERSDLDDLLRRAQALAEK